MSDKERTPARKTARPLSQKRARAAAEYVGQAKGNMAEAMRLAGYSEKTALHQATRLLNDPQVRAEIARLMERHELTDALAAEKHAQLFEAQRQVRAGNKIVKVPDNATQLGALELYYKLKGRLWPKHYEIKQVVGYWTGFVTEIIEKHIETPDARAACLDEIVARLRAMEP